MRYTQEQKQFLAEIIPGRRWQEIQALFMDRYGVSLSMEQIKSYKVNNHIPSGTKCGFPKGTCLTWSPEAAAYIQDNYHGIGPQKMTAIINEKFGLNYTYASVRAYYKNHGLQSGECFQFEPGHTRGYRRPEYIPAPEGFTRAQFKPGNVPHNALPIGAEVVKSDGYLWRKIRNEKRGWRQVHLIVWEEANGPIPRGHCVIFLDGDKLNISLDNMRLVSRAVNLEMSRTGLRFENADLNNAAASLAALKIATRKKQRERHK